MFVTVLDKQVVKKSVSFMKELFCHAYFTG